MRKSQKKLHKSISIFKPVLERPKTAATSRTPQNYDKESDEKPLIRRNQSSNFVSEEDRTKFLNSVFDQIVSKFELMPINIIIERFMSIAFQADCCYFWVNSPKYGCIYSPTLNLTSSYNELPGYAILTKDVIQITIDSPFPRGFHTNRKICSSDSAQLLFPIYSSQKDYPFRGLIHVIKNPGSGTFSKNDHHDALFFMKKFSIYVTGMFSNLSITSISLNLFDSGNSSIDPTVLLKNTFLCDIAEIWHFDVTRNYCSIFDSEVMNLAQVIASNVGIVQYAVDNNQVVYENDAKNNKYFSPEVDDDFPGPLLIVPFLVTRNDKWAIALRGRKNAFCSIDEFRVKSLIPFIIKAVNGYSEMEDNSMLSTQLSELFNLSIRISSVLSLKNLLLETQRLTGHIADSHAAIMYFYDEKKCEIYGNITNPYEEYKSFSAKRGIAGIICTAKKSVNLINVKSNSYLDTEVDSREGTAPQQILGCPILHSNGNAIGCLFVVNRKTKGLFTTSDEKLLAGISAFVSTTFENAIAVQNLTKFSQELSTYVEKIRKGEAPDEQFNILMKSICVITKWERISIYLLNTVTQSLNLVADEGNEKSKDTTFAMRVFESKTKVEEEVDQLGSTSEKSLKICPSRSVKISAIFVQKIEEEVIDDTKEMIIGHPIFNNGLIVGVLEIRCKSTISSQERGMIDMLRTAIEDTLHLFSFKETKTFGTSVLNAEDWVTEDEMYSCEVPDSLKFDMNTLFFHDFNVFQYENIDLFKIIFTTFDFFHLFDTFKIRVGTFFSFLSAINSSSGDEFFSSFKYAVGALQYSAYLMKMSKIKFFTPHEKLSILLSCLFLCLIPEERTRTLSDIQSYSTAIQHRGLIKGIQLFNAFDFLSFNPKIANEEKLSLFKNFSLLLVNSAMSMHRKETEELESILQSGEYDPIDCPEHRQLLLIHLFKCSTLAIAARQNLKGNVYFNKLAEKAIVEGLSDIKSCDERDVKESIFTFLTTTFKKLVKAAPELGIEAEYIENTTRHWKKERLIFL